MILIALLLYSNGISQIQLDSNNVSLNKNLFKETIIKLNERNSFEKQNKFLVKENNSLISENTIKSEQLIILEEKIDLLNENIKIVIPEWWNRFWIGSIISGLFLFTIFILTK